MKLIIAEKPSVALTIAKVIGAKSKKIGYYEGNNYIVSWCVGHLIELVHPAVYDEKYSKWNIADLPIIPNSYQYKIKKQTVDQYNVLKKLFNDSRVLTIICATDAGREGELIFRHVYNSVNCKKPFERLWISSLEDNAIIQGLNSLKPGNEYDNLYNSALCRERADWLVGINASRFYTLAYGNGNPLSIGRVQTPTLAMIVNRDNEIKNFKKEKYYNVELNCGAFSAYSEKITNYDNALNVYNSCNLSTAVAENISKEQKKINPPRLYDLTTLQRDANRILGLTAQQTLDTVQSLYDKKLATYPRTDSQYITSDMENTAINLIGAILSVFDDLNVAHFEPDVKRCINDSKVTDHHAILPTANISSANLTELSQIELSILMLISNRLLCAVTPAHIYEQTTVMLKCNAYDFKATGKVIINYGFKAFEINFNNILKNKSDDNAKENSLPNINEGQEFAVTAKIIERFTAPPKAYTEDTLLKAMELAGNSDYISSDVERKGLGTPATRAAILEQIINKGYVVRDKKKLLSTAHGQALIDVVPAELKSAKMTADWENRLTLIAKGEPTENSNAFMTDIESFVKQIVDSSNIIDAYKTKFQAKNNKEVIGICPRCGSNIYESDKSFYCSNKDCKFVIFKNNKFFTSKKKAVTAARVKELLLNGRVHIKDLWSENKGRLYDADVVLDDTGTYVNFRIEFGGK